MTALTFSALRLRKGLEAVRHAANKDGARPVLATILLEGDPDGFRLVAADNYRLAAITVPVETGDAVAWGRVLVAASDAALFTQLLSRDRTGAVASIESTDGRVRLAVGPYELSVAVVDGEYPDYRAVLLGLSKGSPVAHATVNYRFLGQLPGTLAGIVRIQIGDPLAPVLITGSVEEHDDYTEYIMPVRTAETGWTP